MTKRKRRKRKRPRRRKVGYVQHTDAATAGQTLAAGDADVLFAEQPDRERWAAAVVASFRAAGLAAEVVSLADLMGTTKR